LPSSSSQIADPPLQEGLTDLVFDEDEEPAKKKLRSRAVKLLSSTPPKRIKAKIRPWVLAAGAALIVGALAVPESAFSGAPVAGTPPSFVLTSEPKAEVYRGDQRLGLTPLLLEASLVGEEGLTLQATGFEEQKFVLSGPVSDSVIEKHRVVLAEAPIRLDWSGMPAGSKLTWQGKPTTVEALTTALPGTYSLAVTPPDRPSVAIQVVVPKHGVGGLSVGKQLEQALAKQPALSVTLKAGKGKTAKVPLTVTISQSDKGKKFSKTASLDGKKSSKLILPGAGTYLVKVPASATHQAFSKKLTVKEGGSQNLEIALTPVPPKVASVSAPSSGSGGGGGGAYYPEPVYYSPPPAYYGGGGGGGGSGGASIAPPSF
jgi:hypothetical protein